MPAENCQCELRLLRGKAKAIGMIASGALNLVNRDFYAPWDPVPGWVPAQAHVWLACLSGVVMVLGGVGLVAYFVMSR